MLALSLETTLNPDLASQVDVTILNVPAEFRVEVTSYTNSPIAPGALWNAAIELMFRVTDFPLTQTWLSRAFPWTGGITRFQLKHNSFGKDPSHLTTQHIIWGLNHLMLSMVLSGKYCQTVAILRWEGQALGAIQVVLRQAEMEGSNPPAISENGTVSSAFGDVSLNPGVSHFFDRDVSIQVVYGGKPIDKYLIHLTALRAMGDAALQGLDTEAAAAQSTGIQEVKWKLLRVKAVGSDTPMLRAGHSRIAVLRTLAQMAKDERWVDIRVAVNIEGNRCAIGGFNQGMNRGVETE
ncbi:MAG: hypothetical protein Q9213_005211 [Squamulea squamosa]